MVDSLNHDILVELRTLQVRGPRYPNRGICAQISNALFDKYPAIVVYIRLGDLFEELGLDRVDPIGPRSPATRLWYGAQLVRRVALIEKLIAHLEVK